MESETSIPVLIFGMHRSGTSYLTSLLQELGVYIGEDLLGPAIGNRLGHFEDREFVRFHETLLESHPEDRLHVFEDDTLRQCALQFEPSDEEQAVAQQLVDSHRRAGHWGWKDPRTCLFANFWLKNLPEARCIVIYRHPLEIHLSHLRRGGNVDELLIPGQVLQSFNVYNEMLLALAEKYPAKFLVMEAHAAFADLDKLTAKLKGFLELSEDARFDATRFKDEEFHSALISKSAHDLFKVFFPEQAKLYQKLQKRAAFKGKFAKQKKASQKKMRDYKKNYQRVVKGLSHEERSIFLPLIEDLCAGLPTGTVRGWREAILKSLRQENLDWHQMADDFESLKKQWNEQTAVIGNYEGKLSHIWEELVKVGDSWKKQAEYIKNQEQRVAKLEAELGRIEKCGDGLIARLRNLNRGHKLIAKLLEGELE